MPSHLVEVLFQGVWSSLTGGWFYDTHLSLFINTVHMYTWLFLFALPFVFYIIFPSNFYTWFIYTFTITVLFTIIKLVNHQLNKMFDTNKIMTSEKKIKLSKFKQVEKVITKQKLGTEAEKNESQINGTSQSIDLSTDHMNRSNLIRSNDSIIRQQNTQRSQLIDETILDTETMTVGTNSICIEYSLGSGSFKSKKSKNYLDTVPVCSKTKHRCESKQNEPKAINQFIDDINQFKTTDKFLINEKSSEVNIDITNNCMIEEEMKLNIRKKKKSMEEMSQVNENYIRSLSSPSKLMPDRIRDDYEQAEYLMIDFDYQTDKNMDGKSEKSASNSTEFNIIGLANSLTENIENSSNRSLFKISEESINNIPNNTNSHIFICSKSANELESTTINKISDKSRKTNKNILSKSKRIYSTIDSPKLTKKQAIKKKSLDVETTSISNLIDTENKFQISLSMSSLNLQNSFSKLPRNIENYYDITTSSGKNISRSHTLTSKHIRRAQSDISLNCFEKFIIKNKLSVEDCFYFNKLTKSSTDVRYSNKNSTFARSDFESCISKLINSKYDKRNLERKINILASNSSLLQKKVRSKSNCIPIGTNNMLKDDMRICGESFTSNSDWKRTGAKSSHNLSVFSEFINYSLGISKEDFLQKNNIGEYKESERAASGGMLLSSLSQQLHYEDLNPFKSTLECAKMLRKKKSFL